MLTPIWYNTRLKAKCMSMSLFDKMLAKYENNDGKNKVDGVLPNDRSSGFASYDYLTGGFKRTSLNIFASASKCDDNKLSLAQLMVLNLLANQTDASVYYSADKTAEVIQRMFTGIMLKLHPSRFSDRQLIAKRYIAIRQKSRISKIENAEFIDSSRWDTNMLVQNIRDKARRQQLAFVVVDNLQHVLAIPEYENNTRSDELRSVVTALRELSYDIKLPIIGISYVTHQYADMYRPLEMCDLSESGSLEELADNVTLLYLKKTYSDGSKDTCQECNIEVSVAKNRYGGCGYLPFIWDNANFSFCPKISEE